MPADKAPPTLPLAAATPELAAALLAQIIDSSDDAIISKDLSGTITSWNKAAERIFLYSAEEMIGQSVFKLIPPELVDDELRILAALRRGEGLEHYQTIRLRKDGSRVEISLTLSPVKDAAGNVVGASKLVRDITRQKNAEQVVRLLAAIVDSSDDAIISKTLQGIITSWNKSAVRIFGYSPEEAIGQHISFLIPQDRWEEEPQIIARLQRGERVDHFETIRRRKDGQLRDISLTISPVRNSEGIIVGASKVARDITERKQVERALEAARAELAETNSRLEQIVADRTASLREAVAQMEEFSYTVSHDLRAPLRAMQTYSDALMEEYAPRLDEAGRQYLGRIAANARRMDKMVVDLLTCSRLDRTELKLERVTLDRLAREIVENYPGMQPDQADIMIEPLGDVLAHEPSVVQAIANLLTNAIKFVAPGVRPRIRIWSEVRGPKRRLWIEDNGIGIAPDAQRRLFQMFERMNPAAGYEGNGVGLAIVRKALTRMGGDAGMSSDGTAGSRFWIELPLAADGQPR
jgi:PAS domain S-box-containing protein